MQNKFGETPLLIAIKDKNLEIIRLLIENQVDIDMQNKFGETPLLIALENNDMKIFKLLIDAGAKYNYKNEFEKSGLTINEFYKKYISV